MLQALRRRRRTGLASGAAVDVDAPVVENPKDGPNEGRETFLPTLFTAFFTAFFTALQTHLGDEREGAGRHQCPPYLGTGRERLRTRRGNTFRAGHVHHFR
jgi:hypothetical protein